MRAPRPVDWTATPIITPPKIIQAAVEWNPENTTFGVRPVSVTAKKKRKCIGACGLACSTCPLMKAKKCKGCASGKDATPALLKMKPCVVLKCVAMKKIDYCGTGCKMFTKCKKLIGKPYDKTFIAMIAKKVA